MLRLKIIVRHSTSLLKMFLYMSNFILSHSKRVVQDAIVSAVKRSLMFKVIQVSPFCHPTVNLSCLLLLLLRGRWTFLWN